MNWQNLFFAGLLVCACYSCKPVSTATNAGAVEQHRLQISTNKAFYHPGEKVAFTLEHFQPGLRVRYYHLGDMLAEEALTTSTWNWQPPATDFRGYMVALVTGKEKEEKLLASIAVDVSSDWSKFPRYGFLSEYGSKTTAQMDSVITSLNRRHINGLQFYDWMDKHHQPLAGTPAHPAAEWKDIGGRDSYKATVEGYIQRAHARGMQAMFYNLCYGALDDAAADGVKPEWYMYRDSLHGKKDLFDLPQPMFKSDIWFLDPSNNDWQQYMAAKNEDVYKVFDFDGYHIDQVGNRDGNLYRYNGSSLDLEASFHAYITGIKAANPGKHLVFNAVNQYGQQGSIATAPVDFIYAELWDGNEEYKDLAGVIRDNYRWSNGKATVLAAYMNYKKADAPGTFNAPGVLLTDAVIFAFGGSHIELGEHMLGKEYFPNNNLRMSPELSDAMTAYYDFMTGYENLLRDGGDFNTINVVSTDGKMNINNWPPQQGSVAVQGKKMGDKQVIHFINFSQAIDMHWRDTEGKQPKPVTITGANLQITVDYTIKKVWCASPDFYSGLPVTLPFHQEGNMIKLTLPSLSYWDMLVMEKQ